MSDLKTIADRVFTSSTPETRPAFARQPGARWRVSHRDELTKLVELIAGTGAGGAYTAGHPSTPSGRLQLFAGIRDNRDKVAHSLRCEALLVTLKGLGLKVKRERMNGRTTGVIVTDRKTRAEA